jgi:GGDEF domain-containing protein
MFAEAAARELRWYWTNTLTRAVAARSLSEQLWHQSGDEAFIAGLLQDIGILVLMRELGAPYVKFLSGAIDEKCCLAVLEQDTLGFDHTQLSAALLGHWQLPQRLVDAIAAPKRQSRLSRMTSPEGDLPQILHLADLLVQVVGHQQFNLLPDLLEAGRVYRGMTKQKLTTLVEGLQPQVDQLAEVLSLELLEKRDYVQMLLSAHEAMVALSEDMAGGIHSDQDDDQEHELLLAQTRELSQAMRDFLERPGGHLATDRRPDKHIVGHAAHPRAGAVSAPRAVEMTQITNPPAMLHMLLAAANRCREHRRELSLLLVEPNRFSPQTGACVPLAGRQVQLALHQACSPLDPEDVSLMPLGEERMAAVLSNCERIMAVAVAHNVIAAIGKYAASMPNTSDDITATVSIGIATVGVVPRNFDAMRLIERAERCLSAARACGISTVKSIEV